MHQGAICIWAYIAYKIEIVEKKSAFTKLHNACIDLSVIPLNGFMAGALNNFELLAKNDINLKTKLSGMLYFNHISCTRAM